MTPDHLLWTLILPWTGDDIRACRCACISAAAAGSDALVVARWLVATHGGLAPLHAPTEEVLDVLLTIAPSPTDADLVYALVTSPRPMAGKALLRVLDRCAATDAVHLGSMCFVLGCLHGRNGVVQAVFSMLCRLGAVRRDGLRLVQGLDDQDWQDIVGLIVDGSTNVLDVGVATAMRAGQRTTARMLRRMRRRSPAQ